MGLEYMFFDAALRDRFVKFAAGRGIASTTRPDTIAGFVVELPDGLAAERQEAVETEYESIMDEQMLRAEADAELVGRHAAGITVTLADGTTRSVRIPPPIARRLLEHFHPRRSPRDRQRHCARPRKSGRRAALPQAVRITAPT